MWQNILTRLSLKERKEFYLQKMLDTASAYEGWEYLYFISKPQDVGSRFKSAFYSTEFTRKVEGVCIKKLAEFSRTFSEWSLTYNDAVGRGYCSKLKTLALTKMLETAGDFFEYKRVRDKAGCGSDVYTEACQAMARIQKLHYAMYGTPVLGSS